MKTPLALLCLFLSACAGHSNYVVPLAAKRGLVEAVVYTRTGTPDTDIYLFEKPGAEPRRIVDNPALDYNAVFSPDGRWVVFTSERSGDADLYALELGSGAAPVRLTRDPAMDDAAAFAPDGERLAFVSTRDGDADIFMMQFVPEDPASEEAAVNLTRRPGGDFNPAFSPDGRRIAFSRQPCLWEGAGSHCMDVELCVMDADGANVRVLPTSPEGIPAEVEAPQRDVVAGSPAWSPDGGAIYYYSQAQYYVPSSGGGERTIDVGPDVRRIDLDGGDRAVARNGYSPAIGAGGRFAFVRPDEGDGPPRYTSGQVVSVGADGSDLRAESASVPSCFAPDVDERTGRLACHGSVPAVGPVGTFGLPFAPPGGLHRVRLPDRTLELRGVRGAFPALTPAGELLSTTSGVQRAERTEVRDAPLRVSALDGTGSRPLFAPAAGVAWDPTVASEAGWVVLTVGQPFGGPDEDVDIWKVRLDGLEARNLTGGVDVNCALPGVSANGRRVVFRRPRGPSEPTDSPESPGMAIYVMDGDGRNPHRLTDAAAYETAPALSPDGEWVVYAAYAAQPAEDALKLWLRRADGMEGRLLEPDRSDIPDLSMHPSFSPDGRWIVFTSDRAGLDDEWPLTFNIQPYGELWAVPVAGGPAVRLTHNKWEDGPSVWGFVKLPDTER